MAYFRSVYKELHADRETGCGASCTPFAPAGKQAEFLRMGMSKKSACFQRTAAGI
ncbi:exodeoxyribonuclease V subunit alpha [Campylobacter jejuni subsp. jejuni]|nr:exodeoxyribonuclease V subunit alpha [Campylobacter jejuni subsp. jejuni]PJQ94611.1 exodeoxyribonuclease V subunit alpha [Campylobacter jejuni subsp. jejuni]PJQ98177.1 exodeoxyribonuclease V subunit alpha [Campylobacter jejuni subsp. jejuni]